MNSIFFSFKDIKHLPRIVVVHYGKDGNPQDDVYMLGAYKFDTIFQHRNERPFSAPNHLNLFQFRNMLNLYNPPNCFHLLAVRK